ncbi:MAG: 50S ribosomal protein L44e [Promethearchaeota archaeon]|nr:MAG: 50S ribosomal protein L44e [Candidatus Lokiarchaeota archaeon]
MKIKKELRKFCPKCKKHTIHTVGLYKKGKERVLSQGHRRYERKKKGYGSQPKPIQKKFAKVTKKSMFRLRCKDCNYTLQTKGFRSKRVDIV